MEEVKIIENPPGGEKENKDGENKDGEKKDEESAKHILFDITSNKYGYEGLCLSENIDKLAGMDVETSIPTLSQLAVGIMRAYTKLKSHR